MLIREIKRESRRICGASAIRSAGGPFHKDRFFSALGPFQKGHLCRSRSKARHQARPSRYTPARALAFGTHAPIGGILFHIL
jgi:hypothetical protein